MSAARERYELFEEKLGAKGDSLAESRAEVERRAQEADAALAEANETTARVRDRVAAQRARAELAEACLAGVADILRRFYAGEDLAASIERTTEELEEIATECE